MKIVGIVAEYNPFHNGHEFHINETRKRTSADFVVSVMSGNFVQRGEPALYDKHTRARAALAGGVDMVIELPVVYSVRSAEFYAKGAVSILNSLNCIDYISFGMEHNSINDLQTIAQLLVDNHDFKMHLAVYLKQGMSFPKARQLAVMDVLGEVASLMSKPNNILAIEYLKILHILKSTIQPISITRMCVEHSDKSMSNDKYASSTALRECILNTQIDTIKNFIPNKVFELIRTAKAFGLKERDIFEMMCMANIIRINKSELKNICDVSEGLENRFKKIPVHKNLNDFLDRIKTKRYAHSRLRRIMVNAFLGITNELIELKNINIIDMKDQARVLVRHFKKKASIPVTGKRHFKINSEMCIMTQKEILADSIYDLIRYADVAQ